jgi:diguanylate cyclase (GGDEF)-like protein
VVVLLPSRAGDLAVAMGLAISSGLLFGGCFELWRGRAQRLTARWPLAAILGIHAAVMLVAAADVALGNEPSDTIPPLVSWFGLVQLEFLLFTIGVTVLAVMLCLERIDAKSLAVTRPDTLTGATNRGAFITQADRILDRAGEKAVAVSVIVFDLDGLKTINDTYGRAAGDRVLRVFSKIATRLIRAVDVLGRIGGGEFCVILSDANADAAYVIAERIRDAFEVTPVTYGNCVIPATVSAGVAGNEQAAMAEDLIRAADRALHLAKAHGRNRVEFSDGDTRPPAAVPYLRRVV